MNPRFLALILLAFSHAPAHADHRGELHRFTVEQVTTGKTTRASIFYGASERLYGFHPPSDSWVLLRVPLFEELTIRGDRFTFIFPPAPPDPEPIVLELERAIMLDQPVLDDPTLCDDRTHLRFVRDVTRPEELYPDFGNEAQAAAWDRSRQRCEPFFDPQGEGGKHYYAPAVELDAFLGRPLDWQDTLPVAVYCFVAVDGRCWDRGFPQREVLNWAIGQGHGVETVKALLAAGADVNARDHLGRTALMHAAEKGNRDLVRRLLAAGADPDAVSDGEVTALHKAQSAGSREIVLDLLAAGADVNPPGRPVLYWAVERGDFELVRQLIATGADVNAGGIFGRTALMAAVELDHPEMLRTILAAGADLELRSEAGWTALAGAVQGRYYQSMQTLLTAGADPDIRLGDGSTLLTWAAHCGHTRVVDVLLAAGADPRVTDAQGRTAAQMAAQRGHHHIVRRLRTAADAGGGPTPESTLDTRRQAGEAADAGRDEGFLGILRLLPMKAWWAALAAAILIVVLLARPVVRAVRRRFRTAESTRTSPP